jgi:sigma-54 dependent transcriptional regulator, acetoin dehydrogenase operon transcriptional activator AcoR
VSLTVSEQSATPDPHERAKALRRAWEEFFVSGAVGPLVRPTIAQSWLRSRQLGIQPTLQPHPIERGLERLLNSELRQLLVRASQHVIDRLVDLTDGSSLSFTLTDADGLILAQRGKAQFWAQNERVGAVLGTRWAELDVGTNGIGTALASRQTMQVFAAEHYCEALHGTTCTAALVRHPITRQPIGVFDITSGFAEPAANVWALATQAATMVEREIQQLLIASDEHLLVALAARRNDVAAYAIDLDGRHTIANRGATSILVPEDYAALWSDIRRCVQQPDERVFPHVLKGGRTVLVRVSSVMVGDEAVGAVVVLREDRRRRSVLPAPREIAVAEDWAPFKTSAPWLAPARASLCSSEPILIVGESGSGKSAVAAAVQRNLSAAPLRVVDCASLEDWADCRRLLTSDVEGAVLLDRLLDLQPSLQARLVCLLDTARSPTWPRILATACVGSEAELRSTPLRQDLIDRLAVHVIRVPTLRERVDEIQDIALDVARDLIRDGGLAFQPISKEAQAVLRTYQWPGNVRQLQNVLRRALLMPPRGQIDVGSLPPDLVLAAAEPRFGLIEQLEGETILRTLQSTGGNVSRAAQVMGLSRATVYRRLHAYRAQGRTRRRVR